LCYPTRRSSDLSGQLVLVATHEQRFQGDPAAVGELDATLLTDGEHGAHQVLPVAHASGDAVHHYTEGAGLHVCPSLAGRSSCRPGGIGFPAGLYCTGGPHDNPGVPAQGVPQTDRSTCSGTGHPASWPAPPVGPPTTGARRGVGSPVGLRTPGGVGQLRAVLCRSTTFPVTSRRSSASSPATSSSTAWRPASRSGSLTVVRPGSTSASVGMSSKPAIATSSPGTSPASRIAAIAPSAITSFTANTHPGSRVRPSSSAIACRPPSRSKAPCTIRS